MRMRSGRVNFPAAEGKVLHDCYIVYRVTRICAMENRGDFWARNETNCEINVMELRLQFCYASGMDTISRAVSSTTCASFTGLPVRAARAVR